MRIVGIPVVLTLAVALGGWSGEVVGQAVPTQGALPKGYGWIEGDGSTNMPFGLSAGVCQQVWAGDLVPGTGAMTLIREIRFRRDRKSTSAPGFWVDCEMGFGSYSGNPLKPSTVFANNRNNDFQTAFTRKRLNIAASAAGTGTPVQPWLPAVALDRPFFYNRQTMKGLLWEVKVHGADPNSPGQAFTMDAHSPTIMMIGNPSGRHGTGCPVAPASTPLYCSAFVYLGPGGAFYKVNLQHCGAQAPALITLGRSAGSMGPVALPFDLGPLGAPGCKVYTSILIPMAVTADKGGLAAVNLQIPSYIQAGTPLFAQGYVASATANALGLAASNGAVCYTHNTVETGMVYNTSSVTATSGTASRRMGIIVGLTIL